MSQTQLVTVNKAGFEAVLPWSYAIPPMRLLEIMNAHNHVEQFSMALEAFRDALSPEKLPELDALDLDELVAVVGEWFELSTAAKQADKEDNK